MSHGNQGATRSVILVRTLLPLLLSVAPGCGDRPVTPMLDGSGRGDPWARAGQDRGGSRADGGTPGPGRHLPCAPPGTPRTESFIQTLNRQVDILLVIDPSGSMESFQAALLAGAPALITAARGNQLDLHLGAITLIRPSSPVVPLGALVGDPAYLTGVSAGAVGELLERLDLPVGGGEEVGFAAILAALSPSLAATVHPTSCAGCSPPDRCVAGGCRGPNWGFRRAGASLEILVFTDEDDGSKVEVEEIRRFLREAVDPTRGGFVRVHALLPTGDCCCAASQDFSRWLALIKATGGKQHDLCGPTYEAFVDLADRLFGRQRQFFLDGVPSTADLLVMVDDRPASGFRYDRASRSVLLTEAPPEGATVTVAYCE